MKKRYDVLVYGESESKFSIEATEEDIQAFGRIMNMFVEKERTRELYGQDFMCVEIVDAQTKEVAYSYK